MVGPGGPEVGVMLPIRLGAAEVKLMSKPGSAVMKIKTLQGARYLMEMMI